MQNSKYHRRALQNIKAAEEEKEEFVEKEIKIARTPYELQRLRLEKLLANPDKPVPIPNPKKQGKAPPLPPEFIRNVVGSSAGAGSGEYHIYRNLRKREFIRQEFLAKLTKTEALDKAYADKVEAQKQHFAEKSRKKRAKRIRLKENQKDKVKKAKTEETEPQTSAEKDSHSDDGSQNDDNDSDDDGEVDDDAIAAHLAKYGLKEESHPSAAAATGGELPVPGTSCGIDTVSNSSSSNS